MNNTTIKIIVMVISILLLTISCEDDNPIAIYNPESGNISGTVTFSGEWPETGTISISLNSSWPPTGAPTAYKTIELDDLNSENQYNYSFENVIFDTISAIAVSWQDPEDDNDATNQHVLGAYGGEYPFVSTYGGIDPTTVTVSDSLFELNDMDFNANLMYVNACSKQTTQEECDALDHCMWTPTGCY